MGEGISVPDADILISLSEVLETPVYILLGESVKMPEADDLRSIATKLEVINLQLVQRRDRTRRVLQVVLIVVYVATLFVFACLAALESLYLSWDYSDPELAVVGTIYHASEWVFVRTTPILLIVSIMGFCFLMRRRI